MLKCNPSFVSTFRLWVYTILPTAKPLPPYFVCALLPFCHPSFLHEHIRMFGSFFDVIPSFLQSCHRIVICITLPSFFVPSFDTVFTSSSVSDCVLLSHRQYLLLCLFFNPYIVTFFTFPHNVRHWLLRRYYYSTDDTFIALINDLDTCVLSV